MEILNKFLDWVENRAHAVLALIGGCVLLVAGFIASDNFLSKYSTSNDLRWVYSLVLASWIVYWFVNRFWIPRHKKKNVGLVLCIHADTNEAEQALKKDFLSSIKRQIANEELEDTFDVIIVKNHLATKFNNFSSIKKLHKRTNGHIYIFGETKKRKEGSDKYFLSLDGLVLHRPVAHEVSQDLSKDFLSTLPKAINFNDELAFKGFQISADIVVKSVKYIVGIASFISGNPFLSIKLHEDLKNQIRSAPQRSPFDGVILGKIDTLLSNEFAMVGLYCFRKNEQQKARENLATALKLNSNCYRALLLKSIVAFSWDNDPKQALVITKKCHGFNMPEWRYNQAFLHFWIGNYPSAWKWCEKIKTQNYPGEIATSQEVTQFNEKLPTLTEKPVLYFWLGFNYFVKQKNMPMALKNLELFEEKSDVSMRNLKDKSSVWLMEIRKEMNLR